MKQDVLLQTRINCKLRDALYNVAGRRNVSRYVRDLLERELGIGGGKPTPLLILITIKIIFVMSLQKNKVIYKGAFYENFSKYKRHYLDFL